MPEQTRSRSNVELATERLRALIFNGDLAAGTDHLEGELAERMGMSRTPVREAIISLAAQGLLEVRPRKGVRVSPISPADMAEIYDVLTELESLAAANAAAAAPDQATLTPINAAVEEMDRALAADDLEAWARADDQFHTLLVELGGNARVASIVAMMSDQVKRARNATLYIRPKPQRSNADHRAVVDAIGRGDPALARKLHHAHRAQAKDNLVALLQKHRLKAL